MTKTVRRRPVGTLTSVPRSRRRRCSVSTVSAVLVVTATSFASPGSAAAAVTWPDAASANASIGRGVEIVTNLHYYGATGELDVSTSADLAREAGFQSVRLPVAFGDAALDEPPYTLPLVFLAEVDAQLDVLLTRGFNVILDKNQPVESREKFLAVWAQIAERFAGRPPEVYFELQNEPTWQAGLGSALSPEEWNQLVAEVIPQIRASNPRRIIVVSSPFFSFPQNVPQVALPAGDRHLIVTFHQYQPLQFTHQDSWIPGSDGWLGTTWNGTPAEVAALKDTMRDAVCWSKRNGVPLFVGEFGAGHRADLASRVRWISTVTRLFEAEAISCQPRKASVTKTRRGLPRTGSTSCGSARLPMR